MAKHLNGTTLGNHPELYPYLLEHVGMSEHRRTLTDAASKADRAGMIGAPDEAGLLAWLVELIGAKKCLEFGVFRGTTTLALAEALPADGKVVALDINDDYVQFGKETWKAAGVDSKIDLRIGNAQQTVQQIVDTEGEPGTFDFAFIDADKVGYDCYYEASLKLMRKGGVIAVDNVLWHGKIIDTTNPDADTKALQDLNEKLKKDPRVSAMMIPVADGVYLARKL
eukprot:TRINITY_DN3108_c0_g1_i3.p2 TRINITY_DN3108_c0_g1~~TRINITY_DN3108_c0_g1_i3.p2  ORF type:complete len:225 (+),score=107.73 TRINITY_DN3108_c0_g1_i3:64-738(+)